MKKHLLSSCLLFACAAQLPLPTPTNPSSQVFQKTPASLSLSLAPSSLPASRPSPPKGLKVALIEPWGAAVFVPERAGFYFEPANQQFHITTEAERSSVTFSRVNASPPKTAAELPPHWKQGDDLKILAEGASPDGSFYCVVTFEVRVGMPGLPGQTIHMLKTVSRVYAIVPLDESSYATCTAYLEYDASHSAAGYGSYRDMCLSIRKQ